MYLKLDTKFNPFTYDEMVKPLLYYKQAYDEAEAAYSDLVTQTEAWKDIANRENSPEAFEMYQRYSGDLSRAVEDFSQGMTAKNRRALLGLKRRYAQDITPIARASEAMKEANALRVNAGPDAIFEVGEYNSLDSFLHGKTANNKYQSREALTKRAAAMTEAAMTEALKDPDFKKAMGDQFWMITQHTGGSYEDLIEAMKVGMADNPIAQNRFSEIRQSLIQKAGIQNYDAVGQQAIIDAIDTGLYAGLDKPVRSFQANADHITPAEKMRIGLQASGMALDAASRGFVKDSKGNWVYDPTKDPAVSRNSNRSNSPSGSNSDSSNTKAPRLRKSLRLGVGGKGKGVSTFVEDIDVDGVLTEYSALGDIRNWVDKAIKGDSPDNYSYYVGEEDIAGLWGNEPVVYIVPKNTVKVSASSTEDEDNAY